MPMKTKLILPMNRTAGLPTRSTTDRPDGHGRTRPGEAGCGWGQTRPGDGAHGVTRPTTIKRAALLLLLLSTLILPLSTFAQTTTFTYQGRLTENGAPANSTNDLTFTLYTLDTGGTTVGTSNVVNNLVVSNGLFTVTLDYGASAFDGSARWLQIAARPGASIGAYTILLPRQQITSKIGRASCRERV